MRSPSWRTAITRSTDSRRARNSASDRIAGRRRPDSRPSRRRWRLASRRVDPRTPRTPSSDALVARVVRLAAAIAHVYDGVRRVLGLARCRRRSQPDGDGDGDGATCRLRPRSDRRRLRCRRLRPSSSASSSTASVPSASPSVPAAPEPTRPRPRRPRRRRRRAPLASSMAASRISSASAAISSASSSTTSRSSVSTGGGATTFWPRRERGDAGAGSTSAAAAGATNRTAGAASEGAVARAGAASSAGAVFFAERRRAVGASVAVAVGVGVAPRAVDAVHGGGIGGGGGLASGLAGGAGRPRRVSSRGGRRRRICRGRLGGRDVDGQDVGRRSGCLGGGLAAARGPLRGRRGRGSGRRVSGRCQRPRERSRPSSRRSSWPARVDGPGRRSRRSRRMIRRSVRVVVGDSSSSMGSVHSVRPLGADRVSAIRDRTRAVAAGPRFWAARKVWGIAIGSSDCDVVLVPTVWRPAKPTNSTVLPDRGRADRSHRRSPSSSPCANRTALAGALRARPRRLPGRRERRRVVSRAWPAERPSPVSHVRASAAAGDRPGHRHGEHRTAGVDLAPPVLGQARDEHLRRGPETRRRRRRASLDRHPGQLDPPIARPGSVRPANRVPRRPPRPGRGRPAGPRPAAARSSSTSTRRVSADLEVFGFAGHAGRRGAEVGDLRMRAEAGRVSHRDVGPAQRPLERPREVAMRD